MQIRVLGPFDVVDGDGNNLSLGGRTQYKLLAILAARPAAAISIDDLVAQLWTDDLPVDPVASIRTYVARIRNVLGPDSVVTGVGTYALGDIETDHSRFERLVTNARRSSGSPTSSELWGQAVSVWRVPQPFGEFGDLEAATEEFPRREGLRAQQMTVLARAGRQGEALRVFQGFRGELTDIGLEPSARLIDLDRQITAGDVPNQGARRTLRESSIR